MPRRMRRGLVLRFLLLSTMFSSGIGVVAVGVSNTPIAVRGASAITAAQYCPDRQELAMLATINRFRQRHNQAPLRLSATLGAAAEHHSRDMATNDYTSHTLSDGTTAQQNILNHHYSGNYWGENIAAGTSWDTAAEPFRFWKHSDVHRHNMLNDHFQSIGIGRAYNANSTWKWYWTTTFGGRWDIDVTC